MEKKSGRQSRSLEEEKIKGFNSLSIFKNKAYIRASQSNFDECDKDEGIKEFRNLTEFDKQRHCEV